MKTDNILYIAETDELGRVVCVWSTDETKSRPKPLRRPVKRRLDLQATQCFGASPSDIATWMQEGAS
jgi:hypothetical protein